MAGVEFHSWGMKIYGCPSDNRISIFGCPATFLVISGARTTKFLNPVSVQCWEQPGCVKMVYNPEVPKLHICLLIFTTLTKKLSGKCCQLAGSCVLDGHIYKRLSVVYSLYHLIGICSCYFNRFIRHWYRGHNSCSRTDLFYELKPDSDRALKARRIKEEEQKREQEEQKKEQEKQEKEKEEARLKEEREKREKEKEAEKTAVRTCTLLSAADKI